MLAFFRTSILTAAYLLTCATFYPLTSTAAQAPISQISASIEAAMKSAYPVDGPGASIIVVHRGQLLYRGSQGLANLELKMPLQPESVFRIGSLTKQFTAAAILLLAHEGKLSLNDSVSKYVPTLACCEAVRIEHLLAHTSGIPNYTELPEWASTIRHDVSADDLISLFKDRSLEFPPGEQWKYSNSGYVLLGAIIEKVSGRSYADFMRARLFEPLGMKATRYDDSKQILSGRASGYSPDRDRWMNADYLSMSQPYAAGALVSTVDDLAIWNQARESEKLLPPESWNDADSSFQLTDGTSTRYAAGWIVGRIGSLETREHGGGINGFNAYILRVPSESLYIAVLANAAPPRTPPQQIALQLATRVLGVSLDTPEISLGADRLKEYVGVYVTANGSTRSVTLKGTQLELREAEDAPLALTPIAEDLFEARANHSRVSFLRNAKNVSGMRLEPRMLMGDRTPAKRR